ncbi:MAG: helix-turn-helix transcriptional regulator [Actinobacteria bacterium]|nr:helix-turn-helix transcriptional regulator [Actinomycetota bacterium]
MSRARHESSRPEQAFVLSHHERTPPHGHEQGHLVYPATGVLSLATRHGVLIAPPSRVVWIPAGVQHWHRAHGATDMRIVFLTPPLARPLPAHPAVLTTTALAREATLALTGGTERTDAARLRLRRVIIDDLAAAPEQPLHLPDPVDDRLRAVAALVEQDLPAPVTLGELGRRVGASERTLTRLFHDETGMSFRQWRTQLRVHHALVQMAEGRSVTGTAIACGWSNPSAFIAAFTALVGQTPGRYRQAITGLSDRPARPPVGS